MLNKDFIIIIIIIIVIIIIIIIIIIITFPKNKTRNPKLILCGT